MSSMRDMYVGIYFKDEASKAIDKVDGAMDGVETSVTGVGKQLNKSEGGFKTFGKAGIQATDRVEDGFQDAEKEVKDFNKEVRNSEGSFSGLKKAALGIGGVIAGVFAVDKIKDFGISAVESAASAQAMQAQFDQVFTGVEDSATNSMNKIAEETGILPTRLQGSFTQMAAFAKTTGMETADALSLTERATMAAADSAAFYDRSIEDVTENLRSFLKGSYENDAALGISATETTRNAKANELYGQSFKDLDEAQKQLTLLAMVEDGNKLAGAIGQAARESDQYENQLGNVKQAWDDFKAALSTPFLDQVTAGMEKLTVGIQNIDVDKLTTKIKSFVDTGISVAVPTFKAIGEGMKWVKDNANWLVPVLGGLVGGFAAFKGIKGAVGIFNTVSDGLGKIKKLSKGGGLLKGLGLVMKTNPIGMIATGIGLAVTAGIYLYKNWDTVKEKAIGLWQTIQDNPIGKFVTGPIRMLIGAGKWVYNNFDEIKGAAGQLWQRLVDNPLLGLVAGPIGGLIGAGIYLWKNFDTIKEKAGLLWQKLLDNPMVALVAGPIGGLIGAGILLYQNWDTVKERAGLLWDKVKEVFGGIYDWGSEKIQGVVGFFQNLYDKFIDFKNAISSFKPPAWVSTIGGGLVKAGQWVASKVDGSHSTGLAKVPFDGYRAELHRDESVLTARQSNTLRSAGILQENANGTPELNLDTNPQQVQNTENQNVYNSTDDTNNNYNTSDFSIYVPISVSINGKSTADIEKLKKLLESILPAKVREIISDMLDSESQTT